MVDPDALLLPPCVRKARKKDSAQHWAGTDAGWRPSLRPPATVSEHSLAQGTLPEENLWVAHSRQKREETRQKRWFAQAIADGLAVPEFEDGPADGEELAICEDDEPAQHEMLSLEESAAKSEIWHEVNRDLLECWALVKQRRAEKHKKKEQQRKRKLSELENSHLQSGQTLVSEKQSDFVSSTPKDDTTGRPAASVGSRSSGSSSSTGDSAALSGAVLLRRGGGQLVPSAANGSAVAAAASGDEQEDPHTTLEYKMLVDMERRKLEESLAGILS